MLGRIILSDAELMRKCRIKLKMTQLQLTNAMGYANNQQDGFPIRRIESGKVKLSGIARRFLASLIAGVIIKNKQDEDAIFNSMCL